MIVAKGDKEKTPASAVITSNRVAPFRDGVREGNFQYRTSQCRIMKLERNPPESPFEIDSRISVND
jgi:hypothetical protein